MSIVDYISKFKMQSRKIVTFKDAQELVRNFVKRNNWKDIPNIDKFDHLHEELIAMSQHLRYKTEKERKQVIKERKEIFLDGIGDLCFGLCRLANQLSVDIEEAFNYSKDQILDKYNNKGVEDNIVNKDGSIT